MRRTDGRRARVLMIGTYDPSSARARQFTRLLNRLGHQVDEFHIPVWSSDRTSDAIAGRMQRLARLVAAECRCARALLRAPRPDVALFLYPGHFDAIVLGVLAKLRRIPTILDIFISLYDTVVLDRRIAARRSLMALGLHLVDTLACRAVQTVIVDTPPQASFLGRLTGLPAARFHVLWVGADEELFSTPVPEQATGPILFYGTYIPLHGIDTVVRAAALVQDRGLRFRLIGDGQEREKVESLARELGLTNIEFRDSIDEHALIGEIEQASACLGIFGTTDKAARVVPNKVFQCCCAGRTVVTRQGPAIDAALAGVVQTVPAGDHQALASALMRLDEASTPRLGHDARRRFEESFSDAALAPVLQRIIDTTLAPRMVG